MRNLNPSLMREVRWTDIYWASIVFQGPLHTYSQWLLTGIYYLHSVDKGAKTQSCRRLARGHTSDRGKDKIPTYLNTRPRVSNKYPACFLLGTGPAAGYTLSPRSSLRSRHYWSNLSNLMRLLRVKRWVTSPWIQQSLETVSSGRS